MKISMEMPNSHEEHEKSDLAKEKEIIGFLRSNGINSKELSDAYLIALGAKPEVIPDQPIREEVYALAKMLDDFMAKGFSVNKVKELIGLKQNYEMAGQIYSKMVDDDLKISDKEKKVLKSIVDRQRRGTLTIFDGPTDIELDEINIPEDLIDGEYSKNDLAAALIIRFELYEKQQIKINFSEV